MEVTQLMNLMAKGVDNACLWHARFSHLNFQALRRLAREDMVKGFLEVEQVEQLCTGCLMGKQRMTPFLRQVEYRAESVLELVHGDICGPITLTTPNGNRYFNLLVDDVSKFIWVKALASKDNTMEVIKQLQAAAEAETCHKLRAFRSNSGGEFNSADIIEHCAEQGVWEQLMTPYTSQ
jgi:hypothetical protein